MMQRRNFRTTVVLIALSLFALINLHAQNGDNKAITDLPKQFAATAFGQAGAMSGKSFGVTVYINSWTSDDQVKDYVGVLKEKGPNGLVSAMEKASDVGRLAPVGFVGSGFRFARFKPTENGGARIVMSLPVAGDRAVLA